MSFQNPRFIHSPNRLRNKGRRPLFVPARNGSKLKVIIPRSPLPRWGIKKILFQKEIKYKKIEIPHVQQLGSCAISAQQRQPPYRVPWLHLRTPNCTSMLIILVASPSAPIPLPPPLPSARMQCYCFRCLTLSFPLLSPFTSSFFILSLS